MHKTNYLSLILYITYGIFGSDLVVFQPKNIISLNQQQNSSMPYLWTLVTSVLIETNFFAFIFHLALANYIVYKNRDVLEKAWAPRDFLIMIVITGIMATSIHLMFRLTIAVVTRNFDNYEAFEYASLNFVVMAILIGLR